MLIKQDRAYQSWISIDFMVLDDEYFREYRTNYFRTFFSLILRNVKKISAGFFLSIRI